MNNENAQSVNALIYVENLLKDFSDQSAELNRINSEMDSQFLEIRKKYIDQITTIQINRDNLSSKLQDFAVTNQSILFSVRRSMKTTFGTFGFRTGKPKFQLLNDVTWDNVTELLEKYLPGYVRTIKEPAKDKLLSDRTRPEICQFFPMLNLGVIQDETFFIEPKKS